MMMKKMIAVLMVAGLLPLVAAAEKPNLAGTWQLNLKASNLAGSHVSAEYAMKWAVKQNKDVVEITEDAVHVDMMHIPLPDTHKTTSYTADGSLHAIKQPGFIPMLPPTDIEEKAEWQAGALLIVDRGITASTVNETTRRIYLSEDGKQLIVESFARNGYGDSELKYVFDREKK